MVLELASCSVERRLETGRNNSWRVVNTAGTSEDTGGDLKQDRGLVPHHRLDQQSLQVARCETADQVDLEADS